MWLRLRSPYLSLGLDGACKLLKTKNALPNDDTGIVAMTDYDETSIVLVNGEPHSPEYILIGPLDIFPDLVNELRDRFKSDFTSDPLFKIDLDLLSVNHLIKVQNVDFE